MNILQIVDNKIYLSGKNIYGRIDPDNYSNEYLINIDTNILLDNDDIDEKINIYDCRNMIIIQTFKNLYVSNNRSNLFLYDENGIFHNVVAPFKQCSDIKKINKCFIKLHKGKTDLLCIANDCFIYLITKHSLIFNYNYYHSHLYDHTTYIFHSDVKSVLIEDNRDISIVRNMNNDHLLVYIHDSIPQVRKIQSISDILDHDIQFIKSPSINTVYMKKNNIMYKYDNQKETFTDLLNDSCVFKNLMKNNSGEWMLQYIIEGIIYETTLDGKHITKLNKEKYIEKIIKNIWDVRDNIVMLYSISEFSWNDVIKKDDMFCYKLYQGEIHKHQIYENGIMIESDNIIVINLENDKINKYIINKLHKPIINKFLVSKETYGLYRNMMKNINCYLNIPINSSKFDLLKSIIQLFGPHIYYSIKYVDYYTDTVYSNGDGILIDFIYSSMCELRDKYFINEDVYPALKKMSINEQMIIGTVIHHSLVISETYLPIRLPLMLIEMISDKSMTISDFEYFGELQNKHAFDNIVGYHKKNENDYLSALKELCKYREDEKDSFKNIMKGFNLMEMKINISKFNIPTLDYYLSGPLKIDRNAFIKNIKSKNPDIIQHIINIANEEQIQALLFNWSGTTSLTNNQYELEWKHDLEYIKFYTCSKSLYIPFSLCDMKHIDYLIMVLCIRDNDIPNDKITRRLNNFNI